MNCDRRERILSTLMLAVEDLLGFATDERPQPGERIDEHLKRLKLWDEFDHVDLLFYCERTFGINITREEWRSCSETTLIGTTSGSADESV